MIRRASAMKTEVREHMRGGAGQVTMRHMFEAEEFTAPVRLCALAVIEPGSGIGKHEHLREDEVYYVIRGTGMLDDGIAQTRVNAGDAILTGKGESHAIHNDGTETLELVAMISVYPEPAAS